VRFLGEEDGALIAHAGLVAQLAAIVREIRPAAIFFPSLWESHPDHAATAVAVAGALRRAAAPALPCYQYEVWTPLTAANRVVNIIPVMKEKQQAIAVFKSQALRADLLGSFTGLARYRYMTRKKAEEPAEGFAEAFLESTAREYVRLARVVG